MNDFHDIYERYSADVYRFAVYLCGDPSRAEDIASETFMRAWTAPGGIQQATIKAYLFTIARNLYLQDLRKSKRLTELSDELYDRSSDVQTRAEHKAELGLVLDALQLLPEKDRAALLMRTQDEMSYEEIAGALAITLSSVKVKIHRARQKLYELTKTKRQL